MVKNYHVSVKKLNRERGLSMVASAVSWNDHTILGLNT